MSNKVNKRRSRENSFHLSIFEKLRHRFAAGDFKAAASLCRKAIASGVYRDQPARIAEIYFIWTLSLMKTGAYDKIGQILKQAESTLGEYLDLAFMRVAAAYGRGDYTGVLELLDTYLALHSEYADKSADHLARSYDWLDEVLWLGAEAALKSGDGAKAQTLMQQAMSWRPDNHRRRIEMASYLAATGNKEKALALMDEGISLFPEAAGLYQAKGLLYAELEMFDEAEQWFADFLRQHPHNIDAINNLGVVYDRQGKYEKAWRQFQQVRHLDPGNRVAIGNLKYLSNIFDPAKKTISLCMIVKNEEKFLPGCLESVKGLADEIIVVDTGSTDSTIEIAQRFGAKVFVHPWQNDFSLHRNQSINYATGDWILIIDADEELDPTEHEIISSVVRRKDIDSVSFVVYNKIQSGRIGFLNSIRLFRNRQGFHYEGIVHNQLYGPRHTLMSKLKVIHHGYGLSEEQMHAKARRSEALLLKQIEENPDEVFAHFNLAQIYRGEGNDEKSLEHARIVVERLKPDDLTHRHVYLMALDQMGCAYIGLRQFDKAEEVFRLALKYKPDYLDPVFNLGYMYLVMKRFDLAEKQFLEYLRLRADYTPHRELLGLILNNLDSRHAAHYGLGYSYYVRQDLENAVAHFEQVCALVEDFERVHHLLANCYRRLGKPVEVLKHCAQAIAFGHEDPEIRLLEGDACLNLGDADGARRSFQRAIELKPDMGDAHLGMAASFMLDDNPQKVIEEIDRLLEICPDSPQALATKGDALFRLQEINQAKKTYLKSLAHSPHDPLVLNNLGNCFLREKNYASAEACYLEALRNDREFLPGYRNLAQALINQGKMADALEYLDYYVDHNPHDAEAYATMGDIHYHNRQYAQAIGCFEKYLQFYPQSDDALIRLADCYFNLGHFQAALTGYRAVLARRPGNQVALKRLTDLSAYLQPAGIQ